jgi:MGT family glycosyltransferase
LHPFIAVAREVRARGHDVSFYSGGSALATLAREGFRCFPFRAVGWSLVSHTVEDLIAGRKRPAAMRRLWPSFLVETVPAQMHDLEAALAQWPPDAIVCDIAMWAPILILRERLNLPVIALSHVAYAILPGPEGPIQGFAMQRRGRAWNALAASLAERAAHLVTARTRRRANALRRQFGLAPLRVSVNRFTGSMPLYLVPGAPAFDRNRRDLPPSVRYVGPCLWDKPADQPPPGWLQRIPRHQPVVLVDEGALFIHEPRLLQMSARALARLPLTVILLAGEGRDPASLGLGPLPPNIILQAHAPLSDILPIARALVTNGNSESVMAALQAGLPMVVLPSIWDQAEMACRVAETGAGLRVSGWRVTPARLRRAVLRVLDEPSFRDRATEMSAALARGGGPSCAASLIDELIVGQHSSPAAGLQTRDLAGRGRPARA